MLLSLHIYDIPTNKKFLWYDYFLVQAPIRSVMYTQPNPLTTTGDHQCHCLVHPGSREVPTILPPKGSGQSKGLGSPKDLAVQRIQPCPPLQPRELEPDRFHDGHLEGWASVRQLRSHSSGHCGDPCGGLRQFHHSQMQASSRPNRKLAAKSLLASHVPMFLPFVIQLCVYSWCIPLAFNKSNMASHVEHVASSLAKAFWPPMCLPWFFLNHQCHILPNLWLLYRRKHIWPSMFPASLSIAMWHSMKLLYLPIAWPIYIAYAFPWW